MEKRQETPHAPHLLNNREDIDNKSNTQDLIEKDETQ